MSAYLSPLLLPVQTVRLVGRNWAPLLVTFCAGYLVHDLLLRGAAELGQLSREAGLMVLSIGVLVNLVVVIVMFHVVRRDLPTLSGLVAAGADPGTSGEGEQRIVQVIGRGLLPFLIVYGAWGLYLDDVRTYANLGLAEGDLGLVTDIGFMTSLGIVAVSLLLRILIERAFHRSGTPVLGVLVAFFETIWMFFAIFSVLELTRAATSWATTRIAWAEAVLVATSAIRHIDAVLTAMSLSALSDVWMTLYGYLPELKDGLLLPLLWLTIAAVVYGRDMQRAQDVISGHRRLERIGGAVERLPGRTRSRAQFLSRGPREKYVPVLNALRLVLNAGPGIYLVFCVFYVGLDQLRRWTWIGVTRLIGPHDPAFWDVALVPVSFGTEMLYRVLQVALLAAAFDLVLRGVSAQTAGPAPDFPPTEPPAAQPMATPHAEGRTARTSDAPPRAR